MVRSIWKLKNSYYGYLKEKKDDYSEWLPYVLKVRGIRGPSIAELQNSSIYLDDSGSARPVFPPTCISSSTNIHFWETIKRRGIQTQTDPTNNAGEQAASHEFASDDSKSVSNSVEVLESSASDNSVKYKALSNLKTSKRHDLAMVFTCKVCETRSVKTVCRESYEKGVVVVRCGGCSNLHLIADRLGWFGEPGSVEDLLAARGEEVRKGSIDSLNLTAEDLAGLRSS